MAIERPPAIWSLCGSIWPTCAERRRRPSMSSRSEAGSVRRSGGRGPSRRSSRHGSIHPTSRSSGNRSMRPKNTKSGYPRVSRRRVRLEKPPPRVLQPPCGAMCSGGSRRSLMAAPTPALGWAGFRFVLRRTLPVVRSEGLSPRPGGETRVPDHGIGHTLPLRVPDFVV